jgi:hypothetical protein
MIPDYSVDLVMGLLQTRTYARLFFRASNPRDSQEVTDEKVETRLHRHEVLGHDGPPLLWAILNESCIRRIVGDPEIMGGQLTHLL